MENKEKIKVTNANQFEKLLELLEKNPTLAKGFRRGTVPCNFKEQWDGIGKVLNAFGPPRRQGEAWQKVWRDLKYKVKKKMSKNKAECNATGGGIFKQCALSPLEERVANLLQFQKQLNPEGAVQGAGKENPCNELETLEENETVEMEIREFLETGEEEEPQQCEGPSTSTKQQVMVERDSIPTESSNSTKRKKAVPKKSTSNFMERQELLEKHSANQGKLLADISNTLSSVKHSMRDVSKYQKKLLEVEEKKIKLLEEKDKREKEMHENEMKIKKIKIMIKEKELQLLKKNE